MNFWLELVVCFFLLLGGIFVMLGALGLLKLPDFYCRLHAPTKATTLGMSGLLIACMIYYSAELKTLSIHELLITIFLLITAPVSAHMLAKTALHHRARMVKRTQGQKLTQDARERKNPLQS